MGNAYLMFHGKIREKQLPSSGNIFGVVIDETNSNPKTAVTYTDDAIGFTPAKMNFSTDTFEYGSWQDKFPFNQIKPCVLKNGAVHYYLNPNDYTEKLDGSPSDITTGEDGDVMVEIPTIWWKFERVGTDLYIRYSDVQVDESYVAYAHTRGTEVKNKIYISVYMGWKDLSNKLRSLSGKAPTHRQTISTFRTLAQNNGEGYEQMTYYSNLMLQVLYLVMFKNRDSQTALGRGYVDGNTSSVITGGTNTNGLFYGENTGKKQLKFCGIEDWYGNYYYWLDGIVTDASRNLLINNINQNFNNTGSGYAFYASEVNTNINGYITRVQGGTETGFIVKTAGGSETTHYTDNGYLYSSRLPIFGGARSDSSHSGAFRLLIYHSTSTSDIYTSSRCLYI